MDMKRKYVTFFYAGNVFSDTFSLEVEQWNPREAYDLAKITLSEGKRPYAFQFSERGRKDSDMDSTLLANSPMYYINGKVRKSWKSSDGGPPHSVEIDDVDHVAYEPEDE